MSASEASSATFLNLSAILAEIADRGWLVNNLFQVNDLWRANLRTETHATDFGEGVSPSLALIAAIANIETAQALLKSTTIASISKQPAATIDLAEIFSSIKPAPPTLTLRLDL